MTDTITHTVTTVQAVSAINWNVWIAVPLLLILSAIGYWKRVPLKAWFVKSVEPRLVKKLGASYPQKLLMLLIMLFAAFKHLLGSGPITLDEAEHTGELVIATWLSKYVGATGVGDSATTLTQIEAAPNPIEAQASASVPNLQNAKT